MNKNIRYRFIHAKIPLLANRISFSVYGISFCMLDILIRNMLSLAIRYLK